MNNDDTFKNTNNNDRTSPGLTPELEVRVVAWVLGEATPAEAAELARLTAENPALADFKRRIEAVHGLVGAAARPVKDETLRLSDERRAKVLAVIGEDAPEASEERTEARGSSTPRWVKVWNKWALPMAACITLCTLLGAVMFPSVGAARKVVGKKAYFQEAPQRPDPSMNMMAPSDSMVNGMVENEVSSSSRPMVAFKSSALGEHDLVYADRFSGTGASAASTTMPPPAPMAQPVSRVEGERAITLGGANTYSGGTLVTSGTLELDAVEQTKSLTKAGAGRLAGEKRQLYAANQEMASRDGFAESAPTAPAPVTANRGGTLELNGYSSSSSLVTDADRARATLFDTARRNKTAGKHQGSVSGSFASNDKAPVLGDMPFEGRLFKNNETAKGSLKSDQAAAEANDSYPVHEAKPQEQVQRGAAGVTITAGTVQEFKVHDQTPLHEDEGNLLVKAQKQLLAGNTAGARQSLELYKEASNKEAADAAVQQEKDAAAVAENFKVLIQEKDTAKLVAKGRSQYLAGDIAAAQETFRALESVAPENAEANYFLARLEKEKSAVAQLNRTKTRAQMVQEVTNAWQRPSVYINGQATSKSAADSQALLKKIEDIKIPSVNFQGVALSKVVSTLTALSEGADTANGQAKGVNVILIDPTNANPTVSLTLRNLSLKRTLDFITDATGYKYEIHDGAVVVRPDDATTAASIDTVAIPIKRALLARIVGADIPVGKETEAIRGYFQQAGVNSEGAGIGYAYDGTSLIVTNTERNIERVRSIVKRYEEPEVKKVPAFDESLRLETATSQQAVSTFSLHVSDASFRIAKAALARGEAPEAASIRPEEFYNAFDYGDPSAVAGEPVACRIEQSAHPFLQQRNLVRIAMKVPATGRGAGQPLRLTVLLDTSGSMEREDRAVAVRAALTSLVSLLGADDRITLIGFARQPHLLADRVPGNQAAGLADLVEKTPFEGGTNLEEALKLAGNLARGQFIASAQNRIVLLTDGAANLGNDDPAQLAAMIAALRQQGIAFDACGVGADGLDDTILEALTRKGDGRYTVINSPEEADAGFAHKLAGAFRPAAENVKVQVRFNPSRVAHYRLIGFEQHRLKTEDFRNDRVDAAELAAEEAAVALYQVEVLPGGEGELGEVFVRFRDVATGNMVERSWTLTYVPQPSAFIRATPSMKLAGTAAFLAEKLRGGDLAAQIRLDELAPVVNTLRSDYANYANDARVQDLVTMFAQARRLTGE